MWATFRLAILFAVIVCLVPAYDAWLASTPDAWDTAFIQMQTTAYYLGLLMAFAIVLKITVAVIVNALDNYISDNAWLALSRVMQSFFVALLFVLMNFHVFLMAWLTYSDGLPWSRFWEFFTDPYVYPMTIVINVVWLCAAYRLLLPLWRRNEVARERIVPAHSAIYTNGTYRF